MSTEVRALLNLVFKFVNYKNAFEVDEVYKICSPLFRTIRLDVCLLFERLSSSNFILNNLCRYRKLYRRNIENMNFYQLQMLVRIYNVYNSVRIYNVNNSDIGYR